MPSIIVGFGSLVAVSVAYAMLVVWGRRRAAGRVGVAGWVLAGFALAYPVYWWAGLYAIRAMRVENLTGASVWHFAVPAVVMSVLSALTTRHWLAPVGVILAAPASWFGFVKFEQGTHGPWYIQSELMAIALSIAVGCAVWLIVAGLPLWMWGRRVPGRLIMGHCRTCGYDLSGLGAGACPECGRLRR